MEVLSNKVQNVEIDALTPEDEKVQIKEILEQDKEQVVGDTWYVLSYRWWMCWKEYVAFDHVSPSLDDSMEDGTPKLRRSLSFTYGDRPPPIDNTELSDEPIDESAGTAVDGGKLKMGQCEGYNFVYMPARAWEKLFSWYGGGPVFARKVVSTSTLKSDTRIELYPWSFTIFLVNDAGEPDFSNPCHISESEFQSVKGLINDVVAQEGLDSTKEYQLWRNAEVDSDQAEITQEALAEAKWDEMDESLQLTRVVYDGEALLLEHNVTNEEGQKFFPMKRRLRLQLGQQFWKEPSDPNVVWRKKDKVDVQDEFNPELWHSAEIIDVSDTQVKVYYDVYAGDDEWIDCNSSRLAKYHTHANQYQQRAFRDFNPKDRLDCYDDSQKKWLEAVVEGVDYDEMMVEVKFKALSEAFNQRLPMESSLLAPTGSKCRAVTNNWGGTRSSDRLGAPTVRGACGLQNLGNTCFMNSTLQCLSNCAPLLSVFLEDKYVAEINTNNPLGHKGRIAELFGDLMKKMWSNQYTSVCPTEFKYAIGQFAPQFSGYQQHDSQELLSFLLDGLHEDLNRVKNKPPTETVEAKGRPSEVVAAEAWETHLLRNQSFIVDLFHGQLQSEVTCPKCERVSLTFDPFMYLSVPLPVATDCIQEVTYVPCRALPVKYGVKVPRHGSLLDLKRAVAAMAGAEAKQLLIGDIFSHRIWKLLDNDHGVADIRNNDVIYAFEVEGTPPSDVDEGFFADVVSMDTMDADAVVPLNNGADNSSSSTNADASDANKKEASTEGGVEWVHMPVLHRKLVNVPVYNNYSTSPSSSRYELTGSPFMVSFPSTATTAHVLALVTERANSVAPTDKTDSVPDNMDADNQAAPLPKFKISLVNSYGNSCMRCSYAGVCKGCELPDSEDPITSMVPLAELGKGSLAVDWQNGCEPVDNIVEDSSVNSRMDANTTIRLTDCLDKFGKREQLSENNTWYCSNCKDHMQAYKKFDIWRTPEILIFHLKRFQYSQRFMFTSDKLDTYVDFPEEIDLEPWVVSPEWKKKSRYRLFAVSNHMGGMGGGHYTAHARLAQGNREWYDFNDSYVSPVKNMADIVSSEAYVLFYERIHE